MEEERDLVTIGKNEKKLRFIQMYAQGLPYSVITKRLNVSKGTLTSWYKELQKQIEEAKEIEQQTLYETFKMSKDAKIKSIGNMLNIIEAELHVRFKSRAEKGNSLLFMDDKELLKFYILFRNLLDKQ